MVIKRVGVWIYVLLVLAPLYNIIRYILVRGGLLELPYYASWSVVADNGTMYTGVRTACKTARSARTLAHHVRPRTTRTPRLRLSRYAAGHDRA